ncbi:hypothetical protein [Methylorubrum extorquens]|uniref:hypothetical protein n=1 Tax=Methylorubrum extorquens TaxID=408 RepID=UPI00015904D1|nr:hypothetical protein [Methylorubrum extorquens]ABY31467.1 hypothetical protein Mext_3078 [Methylorubrum extorquens PA1]WIU38103.1 hypothetical protein KQ926_15970 [Methylorubrum extorquens]
MSDIGVGAVGAALIAGLVSLFGLIIGKEQKVSEFRQAWIDELRKCLIAYLVQINAISDLVRMQKSGQAVDASNISANYKLLNEASHGITFRINPKEKPAKRLMKAMESFEGIAGSNSSLTPDKIRSIEVEFITSAKKLLKFEWKRVKRGEATFVWTKRVIIAIIVGLFVLLIYYLNWGSAANNKSAFMKPNFQLMSFER